MDKTRTAVVQEARDLLLVMEQTLSRLTPESDPRDSINEIFRVVHTIKGSAALIALEHLVGFTHFLESALDGMRARREGLSVSQQALLVDCCDYIAELVDAVAVGREDTDPDPDKCERLKQALSAWRVDAALQPAGSIPGETPSPQPDTRRAGSALAPETPRWKIDMRFPPGLLISGMDPSEFLRLLDSMGQLLEVHTDPALPALEDFDPEACYLRFSVVLAADCARQDIEDVFEFVREESDIVVLPCERDQAVSCSADSPPPVAAPALSGSPAEAAEPSVTAAGTPAASPGLSSGRSVREAASSGQPTARGGRETTQAYVKVPVDRLDALVDLVGELVIAGATASQVAQREQHPVFQEAAQAMEALVEQIRDATLTLRMIPIAEVFQRFPRVVRSVARQLGKDVALTMSGGETELDKSMVEKLSEPLMHIVRNAIDHGLETPRERRAAGKQAAGVLHLAAYHDAGSMVLEVSDDGRGLDYERIRSKAVERGLLSPDETLSPEEACRLLFEPGFSTRGRATRLSGRGVGMDVVRQRIESLRGEAEIISRPGQGMLVRLRLPLTLAIIDGFLVTVGDSCFVIPMDMMVECVDLRQHAVHGATVDLRGEPLPYLRLRALFDLPPATTRRESLVVVQYGSRQRAGLVVDWLVGEFQVVIKPLGMLFDKVGGLSGATILGDGRVGLILDIPQLIQRAVSAQACYAAQTHAAGDG